MPPEALLDERLMARRLCAQAPFLGHYVDWRRRTTDAPLIYHAMAGLAAVAAALGNRVFCEAWGGTTLFPHQWITFIAPSGFYHKSSVLAGVTKVHQHLGVIDDLEIAQDFTPEALLKGLAVQPAGIIITDELSRLLENFKRTYSTGGMQTLTEIYDSKPFKVARSGSKPIVLRDTALTMLAGSTKHWLQEGLNRSDFASGFLARMLFIPGREKEPEPAYGSWLGRGDLEQVAEQYRWMLGLAGEMRFDRVARQLTDWSAGLRLRYNEGNTPEEYHGLVSRGPTFAQKFAMALQVCQLRDDGWQSVSPETFAVAAELTDWTIGRQIALLRDEFAFTYHGRQQQRLREIIATCGGVATKTEIHKLLALDARAVHEIIESSKAAGWLVETKEQTGGRPVQRYRLASEDDAA